jgi:hypothetical protein
MIDDHDFAAMARRLAERCPGAELLRVKVEQEYNAADGSGPVTVRKMWSLHAFTGDWYHVVCSVAGAEAAEEKLVAEIEERREILGATGGKGQIKPAKLAAPSVQPAADERHRETA